MDAMEELQERRVQAAAAKKAAKREHVSVMVRVRKADRRRLKELAVEIGRKAQASARLDEIEIVDTDFIPTLAETVRALLDHYEDTTR